MVLLFIMSLSVMLVVLLLITQLMVFNEELLKKNNLEALESGFEGLELGYVIGAPFFFLAVLFVLFDLELLLLLPMIMLYEKLMLTFHMMWILLMMFVFLTLILEWAWCGLKWFV